MVLNCRQVGEHMLQATGLDGLSLSTKHLANLAGEHLFGIHSWKWLTNRSAKLDARGTITIAAGTWTEASLTLTSTSSFANYTFVEGDVIEITGGTGATAGFYRIASRTSDNAIVLVASIGSAADGQTDITADMPLPSVAFPSDFRELHTLSASNTLINGLNLTSLDQILALRTNQVEVTSSWHYYGAIVYVNSALNPQPTPILELYPNPTANSAALFTMFYRAGWTELTDDADVVRIPVWMEPLFIQFCRAYALGYEDEDMAGVDMRLAQVMAGPVWKAAVAADFRVQPHNGRMRGGDIQRVQRLYSNLISTEVAGPS